MSLIMFCIIQTDPYFFPDLTCFIKNQVHNNQAVFGLCRQCGTSVDFPLTCINNRIMLAFGILSWERIQIVNRLNVTENFLHLSDVIGDHRLIQFIITHLFKLIKITTLDEPLEYVIDNTIYHRHEVRTYTLNNIGADLLFTNKRVTFDDDVDDLTLTIPDDDVLAPLDLYHHSPAAFQHPDCPKQYKEETDADFELRFNQFNTTQGRFYPLPFVHETSAQYGKRRAAAIDDLNVAEYWACPSTPAWF